MDMDVPFGPTKQFNFANAFKGHLCTGQMESVPVGKYAKQSLMALGWYAPLQGRIVGTDDVRSALAFVERGECDVGIVYQTDALISKKLRLLEHSLQKHTIQLFILRRSPNKVNVIAKRPNLNISCLKCQSKSHFTRYGFSELK